MRKIILFIWLCLIIFVAQYLLTNNVSLELAELPGFLEKFIKSFGGNGVIAFLIIASIRPILLIPTSVMVLFGGLVFGAEGIIYSMVGEIIASIIAFGLARYLGHNFIEQHTGQRFKNFEHKLENHSFQSIMLLRLMNFVPNDLISYAAGASNMTLLHFLVGSSIGLIPTVVFYNYAALGISDIRYLLLPIGILVLGVAFGKTVRYEYRKHKAKHLEVVAKVSTV